MVDKPTLDMSVSERIRYFESRRSSNVYIIGHGCLMTRRDDVTYKYKKNTLTKYSTVGIDTGGAGGSFKEIKYHKKSKSGMPEERRGQYTAGKFTIPVGMSIRFYCGHAESLSNRVANLVEGFVHHESGLGQCKEIIPGGGKCFNYRLSFPYGLTINVNELRARHDVIMVQPNRGNAYIPLTTILRDPRCQNATIHWLACRNVRGDLGLDSRNEISDGKTTHYLDHIGGEPIFNVKNGPTFVDDRQAYIDNWEWE